MHIHAPIVSKIDKDTIVCNVPFDMLGGHIYQASKKIRRSILGRYRGAVAVPTPMPGVSVFPGCPVPIPSYL